jgi:hypothetical protein
MGVKRVPRLRSELHAQCCRACAIQLLFQYFVPPALSTHCSYRIPRDARGDCVLRAIRLHVISAFF